MFPCRMRNESYGWGAKGAFIPASWSWQVVLCYSEQPTLLVDTYMKSSTVLSEETSKCVLGLCIPILGKRIGQDTLICPFLASSTSIYSTALYDENKNGNDSPDRLTRNKRMTVPLVLIESSWCVLGLFLIPFCDKSIIAFLSIAHKISNSDIKSNAKWN